LGSGNPSVILSDSPSELGEQGDTLEATTSSLYNVASHTLLGDAESWEIEYASRITLNSSNTYFAAMVTLKRVTNADDSVEQLQLWETGSGTVVWRHLLPSVNYDNPAPSFGPDGRYFCFHDGLESLNTVDTQSPEFMETVLLALPSEGSSGLGEFEWNLRNHRLSSFALSFDATRIALAALDPTSDELSLRTITNQSGGVVRYVDQMSLPIATTGKPNEHTASTMRYTATTAALFVVWENDDGVIVHSFNIQTRQHLSQYSYRWSVPRDWEDPIRIYGTTRLSTHECLVLSVPTKVSKNKLTGRLLPGASGRKILALGITGKEKVLEFKKFTGRSTKQSNEITLTNDQGVICCYWHKSKVIMESWDRGSFRKVGVISLEPSNLATRGYRCALRGSQLTMLSPHGDVHVFRVELH